MDQRARAGGQSVCRFAIDVLPELHVAESARPRTQLMQARRSTSLRVVRVRAAPARQSTRRSPVQRSVLKRSG